MMHDNDMTIFNYLNPSSNDILIDIKDRDLYEILKQIDKYYLEYRDVIGIDSDNTFGIELEMEHFKGTVTDFWPFQLAINNIVGNSNWDVRNDITLNWGREIVSEILRDNNKTWMDIKKVCEFASLYGKIDLNCSSHVHVGSQILGNNTLYWYRLFKLWSVYENVIYRFSYGEYLTHRPRINTSSKPVANFFDRNLPKEENINLIDMLYSMAYGSTDLDFLKNYGLSYWHMLCDNDYNLYEDYNKINKYCTIEYRCPNGTMDYIVWQNYINFFIKMILYCKSDKFDDNIIDRRKKSVVGIFDDISAYSRIYLEQAIELCDMIFDNNLDKIYFLRQYLKSFEVGDKPFLKCKKFTMATRNK